MSRSRCFPSLLALMVICGCASTSVTNRKVLVNERLPRPTRILVYNFIAAPSDVPADSALAGQLEPPSTPPTAEQIAAGRQLGIQIAQQLAENISEMGLYSQAVPISTRPMVGDVVIKGYLVSVDEGSATKRMLIGFGSGSSELKTVVEGFQMTPQGLRKLGSGTVDSGGGKGPGAAAPAAVTIATANPIGLIVSGGMKIYGEYSGSAKLEGRAKATAKEIADVLKERFQAQGWID